MKKVTFEVGIATSEKTRVEKGEVGGIPLGSSVWRGPRAIRCKNMHARSDGRDLTQSVI
jgi:hypothetical protein